MTNANLPPSLLSRVITGKIMLLDNCNIVYWWITKKSQWNTPLSTSFFFIETLDNKTKTFTVQ